MTEYVLRSGETVIDAAELDALRARATAAEAEVARLRGLLVEARTAIPANGSRTGWDLVQRIDAALSPQPAGHGEE